MAPERVNRDEHCRKLVSAIARFVAKEPKCNMFWDLSAGKAGALVVKVIKGDITVITRTWDNEECHVLDAYVFRKGCGLVFMASQKSRAGAQPDTAFSVYDQGDWENLLLAE